jgi:hypothetical protein
MAPEHCYGFLFSNGPQIKNKATKNPCLHRYLPLLSCIKHAPNVVSCISETVRSPFYHCTYKNLLGASSMGVMHGPSCNEKCAKNTMIFINADLTSVLGQLNRYSQNLHRNN